MPAIAEREGMACTVADLPPAFTGEADGVFVRGTAREIPRSPASANTATPRADTRPSGSRPPATGHRPPATGHRPPATGR